DRMYGRVTRLFITPIISAFRKILGHLPFLDYMDNFRYPLAGEFSMIADLARVNRIPSDWGLEVGILAEIFRNVSTKRICQVDICDNYEHKHQNLSSDNPEGGLLKMCVDISKSLFRTLATEGIVFSEGFFNTLKVTYLRTAQDIPISNPRCPTFSGTTRLKSVFPQEIKERRDSITIIPDKTCFLWKNRKEIPCMFELVCICPSDGYDYFI
ncbi:MAG TPA: glycosyl transferase, partial [Thermodesulfobacteriota bacterium]|nr:glycosyl transferase [Thermodesulfobacteriota bacterium]